MEIILKLRAAILLAKKNKDESCKYYNTIINDVFKELQSRCEHKIIYQFPHYDGLWWHHERICAVCGIKEVSADGCGEYSYDKLRLTETIILEKKENRDEYNNTLQNIGKYICKSL